MPTLSTAERLLWLASIVLTISLIARLVTGGLHRVYRSFFVCLCVSLAQSLLLLPSDPSSDRYVFFYLVSEPAIWFLFILTVLELYSLVLHNHQGIASLGRWAMTAALGLAVGISMLTMAADLRAAIGPERLLLYYTAAERGIATSLVIFLVLVLGFLTMYPVPLKKNVVIHAAVFAAYFLTTTLLLFVRNLTGLTYTRPVSAALIAVADVCFLVWILLLKPEGEEYTVVLRHQWRPEDEERLLQQLDAINKAILHTRDKQL